MECHVYIKITFYLASLIAQRDETEERSESDKSVKEASQKIVRTV